MRAAARVLATGLTSRRPVALPRRLGRGGGSAARVGLAATTCLAILAAGCGSSGSSPATEASATPSTQAATTPVAPLVGRWEQVQTCQALVHALDNARLGTTAPAVVGNYFPGRTPRQIAAKPKICSGATPQTHSHFFTAGGSFGSVDQHDDQVDDGHYTIINDHTLRIGPTALFHYTIVDDDTLILHPAITAAERRHQLANPLKFSDAGWEVAVTYGGLPWKRVACNDWC